MHMYRVTTGEMTIDERIPAGYTTPKLYTVTGTVIITAAREQAIPVAIRLGKTLSRESEMGVVKSRIPASARKESWKEMEKKYSGNIISVREKENTSTRIRLTFAPTSLPVETRANIITARSNGKVAAGCVLFLCSDY